MRVPMPTCEGWWAVPSRRSTRRARKASEQGFKDWWAQPQNEKHTDLFRLIDHCETHYESKRRTETLIHLAMYGDRYALQGLPLDYDQEPQLLRFNLTKSVIDTVQSEIAAMRPRATILTNMGDWGQKKRAQAMEMAVAGEYEASKVYRHAPKGFLNAAKTGLGGLCIYQSGWRPKIELIPVGATLVDPIEAMHGDPKGIYRIALVPRQEALGRWGQTDAQRKAINSAPEAESEHWFPWLPTDSQADPILVVQGHRAPDPSDWYGADKGRHVIAVQTGTLVDVEWNRPHPSTFFRYDDENNDFYGKGICANLLGLQRELNETLLKIQDCIRLAAGPRTWVPVGAEIDVDQLDDVPGAILTYSGAMAPTTEVANTVPPQLLEHVETTIRRGFEQEGVSMMSAMSRKPAGLDSGAALREYNDKGSKRFIIHSQAYEEWIAVDTAERVIEEKRYIAQQPDAEVPPIVARSHRGRSKGLKNIDWADASLDPGSYQMQVYPSSSLPYEPSGRSAIVQDWQAAGYIDRETAMQLMDFPDVDGYASLELAPYEYTLWHCEEMMDTGEYKAPTPLQDPAISMKLARQTLMRAEMDGAPEELTELIYRYIDDLRAYEEKAMQAQAPAPDPAQPQLPAMPPGAMAQA